MGMHRGSALRKLVPTVEVSSKIGSDRASEKTHLAALKTLLQIIIAERKKASTYRSTVGAQVRAMQENS